MRFLPFAIAVIGLINIIAIAASATRIVTVLDGDTLIVGKEHVRLLGVDAPELPGHCAKGRDCAPGDPYASRDALRAEVAGARLVLHRLKAKDKYGRTVADMFANGKSVSCAQALGGFARYWPAYDTGGRIARECPSVVGQAMP